VTAPRHPASPPESGRPAEAPTGPTGETVAERFSVVIPLYNKRDYVLRAVASVLAQDGRPDEIIVLDDGSVDGGADAVRETYPTVRVIRQDNAGEGPARNAGTEAATSPWVAYLDADDFWLPGHLTELRALVAEFPQVGLAATQHVEWVEGAPLVVPEGGHERHLIDYFATASRRIGVVWSSTVVVRRDALLAMGGFGTALMGADLECWAAMALHHPVAISERITVVYVRGAGGVTEVEAARRRTGDPAQRRPIPGSVSELSPSAVVVTRALETGDHAVERASLERYLNSRLASAIRSNFVEGRYDALKPLRDLQLDHPGPETRRPFWLASVPVPVLRLAGWTRRRLIARLR